MKKINGIITPTVSPFKQNQVNEYAIEKLMDFLHEIGVAGIFPMGSNGASPFISLKNHKKILDVFSRFRRSNEYFIPGVFYEKSSMTFMSWHPPYLSFLHCHFSPASPSERY